MRWNRFHDEPERLNALAEILLGAAHCDASFSTVERIEVGALLIKAMGDSHLSAALEKQMEYFDISRFDVKRSVARLGIDDPRERRALVADVASVILADGVVEAHERSYLWRLAALLAVPVDDVVSRIGPELPARTTRPKAPPRPGT